MSVYDAVYRYGVFPALQRKRGQDLLAALREADRELSASPEEILKLQRERLQAILRHAGTTCPFWRRRFAAADLDPRDVKDVEDLRRLPILEKDEVRRNLSEMLSSAIRTEDRFPAWTGGSTAAPMKFFRDRDCLRIREAYGWVVHGWHGRKPHHRSALIWGASQDLAENQGWRTRLRERLIDRTIVLPGNRLDDASLARFAEQLNAFDPPYLHGYSQAVHRFAQSLRRTGRAAPNLRAVTVTAESMTEEQRRQAESVFECPVHRIYGTREFGFLAAECEDRRGMRINPLNAVVEFIAPDGSPARPGEPGQVVVTDLLNRATPLIRYRIGDVGTLAANSNPQCERFPRMEISAGRETDFIVTPEGKWISGAAITLVHAPGIVEVQYVQEVAERLTVRYVADENFQAESLAELRRRLRETFGDGLDYAFQQVAAIGLTDSGKRQYVRSNVARRALGLINQSA
ncbi:MAG: hypothetical protein N2C14_13295 [Planctomycetales bacterium]